MALIAAAAVFIISVSLYSVWFISEKTVAVPAEGGTWREGVVGQPVFINPVISSNDADQDISRLVFASLFDLSESIKPDEENRVWTVRLKEGLVWHNGEKITSDDVIFTFETLINPETRSPYSSAFDGASVSRVSELEMKFVLPSSYVFFESSLKDLRVIPKNIFGNVPPANFHLSSYVREPIGSGPYKFKSYKTEKDGFISEYRFVRNESWSGKKPYIKEVVFKFYKDSDSLTEAMNSGEVDGFAVSDPSVIDDIIVRRNVVSLKAPRYYAIFLNPAVSSKFKDSAVRFALSEAIPRNEIIADIMKGSASPAFTPLSSSPVERSETVDISGLEIPLAVPDIVPLPAIAEKIKQAWEAKGAIVTIEIKRPSDIQEDIKNRNYSALLFGNVLSVKEDLYSFWHSSKRFYPGLNLAMWNDHETDSLLEEIRMEPDKERREFLLDKLNARFTLETPAAFIASPDYIYVVSPRLKGMTDSGVVTLSDRFLSISDWYLNTVRKVK